jgi:hypothetical protein
VSDFLGCNSCSIRRVFDMLCGGFRRLLGIDDDEFLLFSTEGLVVICDAEGRASWAVYRAWRGRCETVVTLD